MPDDRQLDDHERSVYEWQMWSPGFGEAGQAKLKIVLEDKRVTAVCVGRDDMGHLALNAAAAMDKVNLSQGEKEVLTQYAKDGCEGYCAGCANICDAAVPGTPYVSDVMRYLMYYNGYGDRDVARELFAKMPADVRGRLLSIDYSAAEASCPQNLAIGRLIAEAVEKLA